MQQSMEAIYESETFAVVEYIVLSQSTHPLGFLLVMANKYIEIINKQTNTSAILTMAPELQAFDAQRCLWKQRKPPAAEVEAFLGQYADVSIYPLIAH
jgi:Protein of unknown function (DUF3567)